MLPFIYWPSAKVAFEIPRVQVFLRWSEILALITILASPFVLKRKQLNTKLIILMLLFLLIATATSLLGQDFVKSFWGNYYRLDGLFTLYHLTAVFFFVLLYWQKSWHKWLFIAISSSSLLISLWTIFLGFRLYALNEIITPNWGGAVGANFGQPNFLAGYLLVTLPFLAGLISHKKDNKHKALLIVAIIFQVIAILLTRSWMGSFGTLIFLGGWVIIQKGKKSIQLLIPLLLIILLFSNIFMFNKKQTSIANHVVAEGRGRIYKKATIAINQKPFMGYGWSNFDHAFDSIDWPVKFNNDVYVDKAHSTILEVGVTTGFIGLLVYLGIIIQGTLSLARNKNSFAKYYLLSFFLYIIHSQTNVISISEEIIFWIILGIAASGEN